MKWFYRVVVHSGAAFARMKAECESARIEMRRVTSQDSTSTDDIKNHRAGFYHGYRSGVLAFAYAIGICEQCSGCLVQDQENRKVCRNCERFYHDEGHRIVKN
jgi:hypothetical protein